MIEPNTFICGDCKDILEQLPDGFADLCLTDPPYGIKRFEKGFGYTRFKGMGVEKNGIVWDKKPINFDDLFRTAKQHIIWGANNFQLPPSEYFIVWNKMQTVDNFASAEYAWTNCAIPAKVFNYSIHQHNQSEKFHPTQKPVALFVWCLEKYSKPNDLIIDPFCGSGTTALACYKTGRRFICIDREQKYIDIAQQRYQDLIAQTNLFEDGALETAESRGTACNRQNTPDLQLNMDLTLL